MTFVNDLQSVLKVKKNKHAFLIKIKGGKSLKDRLLVQLYTPVLHTFNMWLNDCVQVVLGPLSYYNNYLSNIYFTGKETRDLKETMCPIDHIFFISKTLMF